MGFVIDDVNSEAIRLLKNELKKNKESGTYLFVGRKGVDLFSHALNFAKAMNCLNMKDDFCGYCENCISIEKQVHSDLEIIAPDGDNIKIDRIRTVIKDASNASYEGKRKIFIIKEINKLRKEAANALLKTIEEPCKDTFFIMIANDMNILPTIMSRSTIVDFFPEKNISDKIDKKIFYFFEGNMEDMANIDKCTINLDSKIDFLKIDETLSAYIEEQNIDNKANVIKTIIDFAEKKKFISDVDRMKTALKIEKVIGSDRKLLREMLYMFIVKTQEIKKLEKLLEIKESLNYNVNTSLVLTNFFLEI